MASTRAERLQDQRELASQLRPGDWMLFKGNDGNQPVWLGRTVSKEEWSNQYIWKNEGSSFEYAESVAVAPNEYAINVQW